MTKDQMKEVLKEVQYRDWEFFVAQDCCHASSGIWLQVRFAAENSYRCHGRKWVLSTHMTRSELITTALKAVITAEEHEARERFLYRGKAVFGPHIDVDSLLKVCDTLDVR